MSKFNFLFSKILLKQLFARIPLSSTIKDNYMACQVPGIADDINLCFSVPATHSKIGPPYMKPAGARPSTELQWRKSEIGHQDGSLSNGRRPTFPLKEFPTLIIYL